MLHVLVDSANMNLILPIFWTLSGTDSSLKVFQVGKQSKLDQSCFQVLYLTIKYQVTLTAIWYFLCDAHMVFSLTMKPVGLWTYIQEEFLDAMNSVGKKNKDIKKC